eukprot:14967663-Ditylum_brightwellii.AAC.1
MRNLSTSSSNGNNSENEIISSSSPKVIPRAAVSILVRTTSTTDDDSNNTPLYALVQRGKQPNYGIWSLPGGSIEVGETTIEAAKRELHEETGLISLPSSSSDNDDDRQQQLKWYEDAPFSTTDSIHYNEESKKEVTFHYMIAHVFAEAYMTDSLQQQQTLPKLVADDDALDATWWSVQDIQKGIEEKKVTRGVERVIARAELLYKAGFLKTT